MNLQQLKHLVALIDTGSFSKASEKVFLSQPALSRSVQALEEELGAVLIDRIGKRNEATELGRLVAERARKVLLEVEDIRREAELQAQGCHGAVRLGLGAAPSALLSAELMRFLLEQHPKIKLKLVRGSTPTLLHLLREREIDGFVVHERTLGADVRDLQVSRPHTLTSGFLCRPDHPLRERPSASLADICRYPIISTGLSPEATKLLSKTGNPLHFESEDVPYLFQTACDTNAILLGVQAFLSLNTEHKALTALQMQPPQTLSANFVFVELLGRSASTPMRIVSDFCHSVFQRYE